MLPMVSKAGGLGVEDGEYGWTDGLGVMDR